ncbi:MAG: 1-acyl-sn-glycerol-3-phosphate acyltransferase, partial [Pseudopedobacter saltans]
MFSFFKKVVHFFYVVYAFLMFFILMLWVAFFVFIFIFFPDPKSGNYIYKTCYLWAQVWFALIGIRHEIIYEDNCEVNKPIIFVANHQSYMDIPVTVHSLKTSYRILAKIEMAKIPIFGFIYKKAAIMVDRSDRSKRGQSYLHLKEAIQNGISVFVYPEGT